MDIPLCQSEHKPQLLLNDPAAISLYHTAPEKFAGALAPNAELCDAWAEELAPLPVGLAVARRRLGVRKNQMAMVGDQIFTDTLGANNAGVVPMLVEPIRLAGNPGRYLRYAAETPFRLLGKRRPFL